MIKKRVREDIDKEENIKSKQRTTNEISLTNDSNNNNNNNNNNNTSIYGRCTPVSKYKKLNRIGEGTYGFVYRAVNHDDVTEMVALKRIKMHNESNDGFPLTSLREISTLRRCSNHENIVKLIDVVVGKSRDAVFLLFEYCEHDLTTLLKAFKHPFKESEIKSLLLQLLSALDFCHSRWVVHRDIKLSNLLYNSKGQLKLADFGLARTIQYPYPDNLTMTVVTLWYRAPELLLGSVLKNDIDCKNYEYSFAIDMWSVGCIFGELINKRPLMPGDNEIQQIKLIFDLLGCPTERIWPEIRDLYLIKNGQINLIKEQIRYQYNNIKDCIKTLSDEGIELVNSLLTYNPKIRMTARDALRHEYFNMYPYPKDSELMPTFPTLHDNLDDNNKGNKEKKSPVELK